MSDSNRKKGQRTASRKRPGTPTKTAVPKSAPDHAPSPRKSRRGAEPIRVDIQSLTDDGLGVGRFENKEVLVPGAFIGETVECTPESEGQRRIVSKLRRVLRRSKFRDRNPCHCSNSCQGCSLIGLKYTEQLRLKEEKVRNAFAAHQLPLDSIKPIHPAEPTLGYRTSAKLVFGKVRGKVLLGLYRRGSHQVVDVGNCPLHHPLINQIAEVVRDEVERQKIFIYDPRRQRGLLRYLLVRVSPELNKAMVTFVVTERDFRQLTPLAKWVQRKVPEIVSVQQNINASEGNVILGRETRRVLGQPDLFDTVGDVKLRIAPASFFQVNHQQAGFIYRLVQQWARLTDAQTALDLYCGIGGISMHLAESAGKVIGIEVVPEAVRNAAENAKLNNYRNCRFITGDVVEQLKDLEIPARTVAVVNPPRKGCDEEVLAALVESGVSRLIYVSCGPESLARDLAYLTKNGFWVHKVQPVDMFPQTLHVETVVALERSFE